MGKYPPKHHNVGSKNPRTKKQCTKCDVKVKQTLSYEKHMNTKERLPDFRVIKNSFSTELFSINLKHIVQSKQTDDNYIRITCVFD